MHRNRLSLLALLLALLAAGAVAAADTPTTDALALRATRLDVHDDALSGPAAAVIESALEGVQFVALGEDHNKRAVHRFAGALFSDLHARHGFRHVAVEEDPYWMAMVARAARDGGGDAVVRLALQWPNAFHLDTEDEMQFLGKASQRAGGDAPLWGLNQMFGSAHVLARLVELAPNAKARRLAQAQLKAARAYEGERFAKNTHYLATVATQAQFDALRRAFSPRAGSEAAFLIDQLQLSNRIFAPYAVQPRPPSQVFHDSGELRERNMKALFARRYRQAQAAGEAQPKVLALFGQLHLYRARSERTEQYTLGNFLSELAAFNGTRSLHVYALVASDDARAGPFAPLVKAALAAAGDGDAGLVDLRPLADRARHDAAMAPELKRLLLDYDLFVVFGDATTGSTERLRTPNFHWYPG